MPDLSQAEIKYLLQRQREELKTLTEVGRLLGATTDPHELIRLVASYLRQSFPIALCGILLIEPKQLRWIPFADIARVDLAQAVRSMCAAASQPTAAPLKAEALQQTIDDPSGPTPLSYLRSHYTAILTFNRQPIGVLGVFSGKADAFTAEDRHVLDIVANQLGAGLRNTFLLDELRRAGELKNQLLMVIAHELHIPLASIKEGVNLLREGVAGPANAAQQECVGVIAHSVSRLDQMVEKVVMTTQVLTGQIQYAEAAVELSALLPEVGAALRPLAEARQARIEFALPGTPMNWTGDGPRMARALTNLIENAIQATPEGGCVTVNGTMTSAGIELQILDHGAGIAAEELPRIFEQARVVGGVNDRKTGGLGLGLFLAKAVIEAHHGTIHLESQLGQGTRVIVRLPPHPS